MEAMRVTWVGGTWFIQTAHGLEPVAGDAGALDDWLSRHPPATRADLDSGDSSSLRQRFISEFGPL